MWLRLRQIALVAHELAPIEAQLHEVLRVNVCHRDPGVGHYGLGNALLPIGNEILEVVAPIRENTAGGRYLERRGGDGGYMVITQCDDHGPRRARVAQLGIRIVNQFETHEFRNLQMHPKDTGGSFFEIDEQLGPNAHDPDGPWEPAGPDWQAGRCLERVTGISGAEIQADDPAKVAARWGEIAELPVVTNEAGQPTIELANATLRFVPCTDGRPEGLGGIDVIARDRQAIVDAAAASGVPSNGEDLVQLCGTRIYLR